MSDVRLPADAFDPELKDVSAPSTEILRKLYLLPTEEELKAAGGPSAVIGGPPQSVALIEAGASAFSKWWAGGLGATVLGMWASIRAWYPDQPDDNQRVVLWAASIVSAALVLAIGYIVASDLRGRAAAQVSTISARAGVANAVLQVAQGKSPDAEAPSVIALPAGTTVKYSKKTGTAQEAGWRAIAMQGARDPSQIQYLIVKGSEHYWAPAEDVEFQ